LSGGIALLGVAAFDKSDSTAPWWSRSRRDRRARPRGRCAVLPVRRGSGRRWVRATTTAR